MCFYVDEYCSLWVETWPKARKAHRCTECGGTIEAGTVYRKISFIFDGSPGVEKECPKCEAVRKAIEAIEHARGCEGAEAVCPFGQLAEAIGDDDEHYGMLRCEDDFDLVKPLAAHLFPEARPWVEEVEAL